MPNESLNISPPYSTNFPLIKNEILHFYIDADNGDDNNNGTINNPFKTIQKAFIELYSCHLTPVSFVSQMSIQQHTIIHLLNGNFGDITFSTLPNLPGNIRIVNESSCTFNKVVVSNLSRIYFKNCVFNDSVTLSYNAVAF